MIELPGVAAGPLARLGGRGLLLRDAVDAATAVHQVADIDLDGVPIGNAALMASWAALSVGSPNIGSTTAPLAR